MQPDVLREAKDWITRAERDLLIAERGLSSPLLSDQTAFHAQQAAEKALKGFLAANNKPIPKTHNVERLVESCAAIDSRFARFKAGAQTLNPYATQFRYPGGSLEPSLQEAHEALQIASEIVESVRALVQIT